ncbi:Gfo/Idh/MocA family protein [Streptococcus ictaluri]|uniref:Oxidoreductase, NAD-binding domain protein n=1 Tax=Streptococcus ictaluri 707-05 TaxID=764299 RepID=G5K1M1_9STRE|nr:Gfo/Idh/MocA family oxidoreductase [Streptococcus ictaluri]EHI70287.1 oxidoreductase, NAD-binding domain protein [Streptococcus ictaluri 707-05]
MKLAILGTGMIVEDVLPVLKEIDGIDLVSIVSTPRSIDKAEALAEAFGIDQASSSYEEVLDQEAIDTVYIATPNHLHYEGAKKALESGKHVICEKPFTMTLAELDDLIALAEKKGLMLLEAITNQYLGNSLYLKEHLADLGDIKIVDCNYSQYSSRYDAFKEGKIAPAFDPAKGGGALRDLNIYNIHLVVGLFGQPEKVHYLPNVENGVDTSGILMMDYPDFKVSCIGAKDCSEAIRSTIQGNKGTLTIFGGTNTLPEVALAIRGQEEVVVNHNQHSHRMYEEFIAFKDIIDGADTAASAKALEHSREVMAVLEEAAKAL